MLCLDKHDVNGKEIDKLIYGTIGNTYRSIELNVIPCIRKRIVAKNKKFKDENNRKFFSRNQDCIARDLKTSKKYLGRPSFQIITNQTHFDLEKFGEGVVNKATQIVNK